MRRISSLITFLFCVVVSVNGLIAQQPTPPVTISIDPGSFDAYTGQYEDPVNLPATVISFFREGGKFYLRVSNQDKIEIRPTAANKFFLVGVPADLDFVKDASGSVTSMLFRQGGQQYTMKRTASTPQADTRIPFKATEAMIPMRDGVKLYTVILTPEKPIGPSAFLMDRTPYGVKGTTSARPNRQADLAKENYIFVYQDIRGRWNSEGQFMMNRPLRDKRDPKSVDESTDTYDTIDWLLKNVPNNNGRVGIMGVSYDGWLSAVALIDPHPALKASSPQAPMTDTWMGDDFFHNGAWRQTYGHEYVKSMETNKEDTDVQFDIDAYDWYKNLKTVSALTSQLNNKLPTYNAFIAHPAYDDYWKARSAEQYLKSTSVPTLVVGGWWDQEDMYGALATYRKLQATDTDDQVFFVMGPWNHGGWGGRGRKLGAIDFGSDTGAWYRKEVQAPFFACQLKGICTKKIAEATVFESGSGEWRSYDSWPPKQNVQKALYFQPNGGLSFDPPTAKDEKTAFDSYLSDPANPVPYRKRPIQATYDSRGSGWREWLVQDQRFLADRNDVLKWQTGALSDDVTIAGDVIADLYASTTGSDADWIVKLIDVYPDEYPADAKMGGYQLMVAEEIFRGRYRTSFEKPEAIKPNAVLEYRDDLRGNDYTFKRGHRIMVQVQSTWFPLYDRNPQVFVPNIFLAKESDFKPATQRIFRSAKHPSHVNVMVPPGR